MAVADEFAAELADLLAALPDPPDRVDLPLRLTVGDLDLAIARDRDAIDIDLAGWRHRFVLADDDDGRDAAALALDLIGAALFAAARVLVESFKGAPRRATLQLRRDGAWHTVGTQGTRPWNPLARPTLTARCSDLAAPARYRPIAVTALPWAPWAGAAGFFGAAPEAPPAELPVDGVLDLHNFRPRDIKPLVHAFLGACLARGIVQVRIVHGKGIGNLQRSVHALLARHPRVVRYALAGHGGGGWGATIVDLSPETGEKPPRAP